MLVLIASVVLLVGFSAVVGVSVAGGVVLALMEWCWCW